MAKEIKYNKVVRRKLLKGSKKLFKAVSSTLGPNGETVLIQHGLSFPQITKDGVTVAKSILLKDPVENMANLVLKQAAEKSNRVGDGTTTTIVLAHNMFKYGIKELESKNSITLQREMQDAASEAIELISQFKRDITGYESLLKVSLISTNNDREMSQLVTDAITKAGKYSSVRVVETKHSTDSLEVVQGMEWQKGYESPYFINNRSKGTVEIDNVSIFIIDGIIQDPNEIYSILEYSQKNNTLLICEDFSKDLLNIILRNHSTGAIKLYPVKAPGFGDRQKELITDLALITGAKIMSATEKNYSIDAKGFANRVVIGKDKTAVIDGKGNSEKIKERVDELLELKDNLDQEFDIGKVEERIANLTGGIALIKVGGNSETEVKERKDRIDDALGATKAALHNGVTPGGGITLYRVSKILEKKYGENNPVVKALKEPFKLLTKKIKERRDEVLDEISGNFETYNVRTGEIGDALEIGVIDPAEVQIAAIRNAVSVASVLLTAKTAIYEEGGKDNLGLDFNELL